MLGLLSLSNVVCYVPFSMIHGFPLKYMTHSVAWEAARLRILNSGDMKILLRATLRRGTPLPLPHHFPCFCFCHGELPPPILPFPLSPGPFLLFTNCRHMQLNKSLFPYNSVVKSFRKQTSCGPILYID